MRELRLLDLKEIFEIEEHSANDVYSLAESILKLGLRAIPIAVENSTFAILHGHHRCNGAKRMGPKGVSCSCGLQNKWSYTAVLEARN